MTPISDKPEKQFRNARRPEITRQAESDTMPLNRGVDPARMADTQSLTLFALETNTTRVGDSVNYFVILVIDLDRCVICLVIGHLSFLK